ncbi:efflux RND transporter periplasmic adaptor subunit [Tepidicella baoligensis]|uniref:efflux RND transporter periplasmic adaptor subunit n=1 Tax=Tepidicella baoligensis TaxID=2707016 RepID=UPI0015D9C5EF|nr:efflux RND transporter periplasmic adaptor subunit [Tepidicella baoligensis]
MTPADTSPSAALNQLLGSERRPPWYRRPWPWLLAAVSLALIWAWAAWQAEQARQAAPVFVTEPLTRGDLTLTVSANGTLQPVRAVNIGSELSGTVREVLVDVNDQVKRGQVLVILDTATLENQVSNARAALAAARAQVNQTQASLRESEAAARESVAQLARLEEVHRLSGGQVPSAAELDAARADAERAEATVLRVRASVVSAEAAVEQARANLATNETNLSKAYIRSPIDGVVLSRSVDPGNAVAASLQAVTLFTLAQDLRELKLDVNVDEADIGVVKEGQKATFTVSSYPARRYPGQVQQVNFGSTITDNVVTYTTTLDVDNSDLSLRPGMTATANIVAVERTGVLLVPNTALRFMPQLDEPQAQPSSVLARMMPRAPVSAPKTVRFDRRAGPRQIWVLQDGQPVAMTVVTGISDGRQTEVSGEGLVEGLQVITEQRRGGRAR